jgi:pyruvate/2-oxoglutarate dehydrogenase complex dihydrolipoamide acyltransferase (E2) component
LALLEAMKMFTELPSPVEGILVAILVETGQGVKTGTPLFRIATQDTVGATITDVVAQGTGSIFENRFGLLLPEVKRRDT